MADATDGGPMRHRPHTATPALPVPPHGSLVRRRPLGAATLVLALAVAAASLAGCGFELRRAPSLQFRSIQLVGFKARSPLADGLRESLTASQTTRVVDSGAQAQVVFEALTDSREKSVVASTVAGQVREFQLRSRLRFRLRTPAGRELIAPTEILQSRDMSYSESAALAKEQEEALLYRAMEGDIVAQLMRRLAAVPAP